METAESPTYLEGRGQRSVLYDSYFWRSPPDNAPSSFPLTIESPWGKSWGNKTKAPFPPETQLRASALGASCNTQTPVLLHCSDPEILSILETRYGFRSPTSADLRVGLGGAESGRGCLGMAALATNLRVAFGGCNAAAPKTRLRHN